MKQPLVTLELFCRILTLCSMPTILEHDLSYMCVGLEKFIIASRLQNMTLRLDIDDLRLYKLVE